LSWPGSGVCVSKATGAADAAVTSRDVIIINAIKMENSFFILRFLKRNFP